MSEARVQQEPSIEEILASIRRIISEDGETEGGDADGEDVAAVSEAHEPVAVAEEPPDAAEDILELTERVDDPVSRPAAEPLALDRQPVHEPEDPMPAAKIDYADDALVSELTAQRTTDVLSRLAPPEPDRTDDPLPIAPRTLEEVVRGMLRPMLREWLDTYLPSIVERSVERELRRMSRRAEELN